MTITASDIILLFIGLLITGAVGGLTYFLKTQFEKITDKAGAQSEHDANRVIDEIKAAREDANRGIQKLTETFTREVAMNDQGRRTEDVWKNRSSGTHYRKLRSARKDDAHHGTGREKSGARR